MTSHALRKFSAHHLDFPAFPSEIVEEGQELGEHIMGATVVAWLAGEPLKLWGENWLHGGSLSLRFRQHLLVGRQLTIAIDSEQEEQLLTLRDDEGLLCADGVARLVSEEDRPSVQGEPTLLPSPRLDPSQYLFAGADLGSVSLIFDATRHSAFFSNLEPDDPWEGRTDAHPAWLISAGNALVRRSVAFQGGLFAQAGVTLSLFEPISSGAPVVIQGTVLDQFSKGSREFAVLRFTLSVNKRVHAIVDQTIAY